MVSRQASAKILQYYGGGYQQWRYWSPHSQQYAAGDQLLWYLGQGWLLDSRVEVQTHWFGEGRYILVYRFTLRKADRQMTLAVVGNPFTRELVNDERLNLEVVPVRPYEARREKGEERVPFAVVDQRNLKPGSVESYVQ